MVRIEEPQLLAAMHGVKGVVDIDNDAFGNLSKGRAIKIDHGAAHAQKGAHIGQIFQPRDRRLRT